MRILRVSQHLYPDVTGGMAYHVHAMSRDQAAMGHDVTVLTVRHDEDDQIRESRGGYDVIRCEPVARPLGNAICPGLARHLNPWTDADVIHAHSHLYASTNFAAAVSRLSSIPLALTNHGLYSQSAPERLFRWYLRTAGRWTFNRAAVVFCYTGVDRERVRTLGVRSPVAVVQNGVDPERFTPTGPLSEAVTATGPVVAFVGRLVPGKRPEIAVEALGRIRETHPNASLYVVGDGPRRDLMAQRADALGVDDGVEFLGEMPYDAMPDLYRSIDVLILPSRAEGLPRVVMEALVSGVPVVATELEQLRAVELDGLFRVIGSDPAEFGRMACTAMEVEPDVETAIAEFDWTRTVEQTTERLDDLAACD